MSTLTYAVTDSATMIGRRIKHMRRYPSLTLQLVGMPILLLLIFVYVFGGTLGDGLGDGGGRSEYVNYVTPGILLMTMAMVAQGTALSVAMDMIDGVIARFRTMAIARVSVLTGHVVGALVQTYVAVTLLLAVAFAIGFRPDATAVEWLAAAGLVGLFGLALTWLTVALGLVAKTVESASTTPMPLMFLPFLGSAFVPTDSMPTGLRWFAEYQPFTPVIETLRGLLLGTAIGTSGYLAVAWSVGLALAGYLWSKKLYNRQG
jgi:ABC-2 type transport system permease protein